MPVSSSPVPRWIVLSAAAVALVGGIVTLLGWGLDVPWLADMFGSGVWMMPNAALAAAFTGVALALIGCGVRRGALLGLVPAVLGGLTLVQHLTGADFGIDRVVLPRNWGQHLVVQYGRMGLPASVSFTLLGAALLLLNARGAHARQTAAACGLVTASIALLSIVGFLYDAAALIGQPELTAISAQTAVAVLVLSIGVVAAVPEAFPTRTMLGSSAAATMVRRAAPFVVLVPIVVGALRVQGEDAGLYDTGFGSAVRSLLEVALLTGLLAWTAAAVARHERSLAESRERLEGILASISDQFQAVDRHGRHTYVNRSLRSLLAENGVDADRLPGRDALAVWPALAELPAVQRLRDALERRVAVEFETEVPAWSRWFSVRASPTPDGGLAIVSQDVTRRRATEAALRASEAELRLLSNRLSGFLETAAIGLHRVAPDGTILWANEAELAMLGYSREEYFGHGIAEFHDDPANVDDLLGRLRRGERLTGYGTRMRCRDGSVKDVVVDSSVLWDEGRFMHTQCFTRDVTEQRRLERELHERMQQLREADRRKDEFLATLAHELRNPLAPIRNMLEVLRHTGAEPAAVLQARAIMDRQLRHLTRLIDDLLDVSRISTGRIVLRMGPTDLGAVVQHALDGAAPAIGAAKHHLTVVVPPHPVHVHGDPIRLAQIVGNLLDNACKYTEPGGGGSISLHVETAGQEVAIRVRDNGVGVPSGMLARIFDMFTQVDRSAARAQEGLGIGLSLVKRLVEMHGGSVSAHSDGLGQGCEITVRLPALAAGAAESPPATGTAAPARGCRILVVDDNRDAARSLAMLLELSGHTIATAGDGLEALAAAAAFHPDVVLLDIGMPKMDGYEVARRLRADPRGVQLVLVAVTGWGQEQDRQRAADAGFDAHLVKPLEPDALARLLERLLPPLPAR